MTPYAKTTDVNNYLATKQDKGNYVSATTLSDYYKKSETSGSTEIQTALDKKQDAGNYTLKSDLNDYYRKSETIDLNTYNEFTANTHTELDKRASKDAVTQLTNKVTSTENTASTTASDLTKFKNEVSATYETKANVTTNINDVRDNISQNTTNISKISELANLEKYNPETGEFDNKGNGVLDVLHKEFHYLVSGYSENDLICLIKKIDDKVTKNNSQEQDENNNTNNNEIKSLISSLKTRIELLEASNTTMTYASSADDVKNITSEKALNTDLVITNNDAAKALSENKTYKSIALIGVSTNDILNLNTKENLILDDININDSNGATLQTGNHGRFNFAGKNITIKNITIKGGDYNIFEGNQNTDESQSHLQNLVIENMNVPEPTLKHNVINVYTPSSNSNITITDSKFNLNVNNSNALRMANRLNSSNVTITFKNVDWTYENVDNSNSNWEFAGLIIFQPYAEDAAFKGDYSYLKTWKIVIDNCRYNGEKITENNFGKHNAVMYTYSMNGTNKAEDGMTYFNIDFK